MTWLRATLDDEGGGMFAGLSGLVASVFLGKPDRRSNGAEEILARLDQLGAKLDAMKRENQEVG